MLMPAQAVPALPTVRSSLGAIRKQAFRAGVGLRGMGQLNALQCEMIDQEYSCYDDGSGSGGSAGGGAGSTIAPIVSAITSATAPIIQAEATQIAHPQGTYSTGPGGSYLNLAPGQQFPPLTTVSAGSLSASLTSLLPIIIIGVVAVSIFKSR